MRPVIIIFPTVGLGGTELRLLRVANELESRGLDVQVVLRRDNQILLERLAISASSLSQRQCIRTANLGNGRYLSYLRHVWRILGELAPGTLVHFPLASAAPLARLRGHQSLVSWTSSKPPSLQHQTIRGFLASHFGFLLAKEIDLLNPDHAHYFLRVPWLRNKVRITEGFGPIDSHEFRIQQKDLTFVFLGRLIEEKQALRFVKLIPQISQRLRESGMRNFTFVISGWGSDEHLITAAIRSLQAEGEKVTYEKSKQPADILSPGAVYFSLQRRNNYPSRSLTEAMMCGCYPVLTDVGESSKMVEGLGWSGWVSRDFTADELADSILEYQALRERRGDSIHQEIRQFALKKFNGKEQVNFYANLYGVPDTNYQF